MFRRVCIILLLFSGILAGTARTEARNRGLGATFAYNEFSAGFIYTVSEKDRMELAANVDMNGVISGRNLYPGFSVQFIYGFVFASKTFPNGERIKGIAGPGIKAGYVKNYRGRLGGMGGICGKIGFDYDFNVPVTLSFSFVPLLAFHVSRNREGLAKMDLHKYGLRASLVPHVGIFYRF